MDDPIEILDETENNTAKSKTELDIENHLLGTTVKLSDGTQGHVFSRNGRNKENQLIYSCHLCGVANLPGERVLQTHIAGRKHQSRLNLPSIDADQFRNTTAPKPAKVQMRIAPGEPVPPGMENEVKPVAELQSTIDRFKEGPMVGLEYIMELTSTGMKEPSYHCVLCDKKGDPRTIVVHITSHIHRMKFLEKHYPTVINELSPYRGQRGNTKELINRVVQTVCEAIEDHHGRLTPNVHESTDYTRNKMKYLQEVIFEKHFDERTGPKFVEVIDKKMLQEQLVASGAVPPELKRDPSPPVVQAPQKKSRPAREGRKSLDSISSMDSVQSISSGDSKGNGRPASTRPAPSGGRLPPHGGANPAQRNRAPYYPPPRETDRRRSPNRRSRSPDRHRSPERRRSPLPFRRSPVSFRRSPPSFRRSPVRKRRSPPPRRRPSPGRRRSPARHDRSPLRFIDRKASISPGPEQRKTLPTPKQLSMQASEIAHERYKWEKYRCTLEIASVAIDKTFKEHEKNPEKHPMYPDEWKKFWNRRYKELQAEKKDPSKHDFKPEWIEFWTKRMKELHDEEIDKKKAEIRKKLNLPEEESEKTKELKEQYTVKVAPKKKRSIELIDSSEDERMSVKSKTMVKGRGSRDKKSKSPISEDEMDDRSRHSRNYSREKERERDRGREQSRAANYRMASYLQEKQDYEEWAKSYYGPNKKVFVRTEYDNEDVGPLNFVSVCRLLTALEEYLGSLGPRVIDLLSKSLALEKVKANSADDLLLNEDNCMFLETVKEKLKGHLMADMLEPQKIAPVKKAIKNIASLIHEASKKEKEAPPPQKAPSPGPLPMTSSGAVDKVAIAQKLAAALVAQGKTDFTSDELEELINVYVAMAEASKDKDKPVTSSSLLNDMGPSRSDTERKPESSSRRADDGFTKEPTENTEANALEGLTDSDLQTLLQNFKDLSNEEQLHLISHLKKLEKTDPLRVEKLRRYVNLDDKPTNSRTPQRSSEQYYDDNDEDRNYDNDEQPYDDDEDNFEPDRLEFDNGVLQGNQASTIKPLVSGSYGEDSPDPYPQKKLIDSEDEDDYSYDDVVRAASKNVTVPLVAKSSIMLGSNRRQDYMNDLQDGNSNFSRASNEHNNQMDQQKVIANMMGSLSKPGQGQNSGSYSNPISTIGQAPMDPRQNSNFYDNSSQHSFGSSYSGGPSSKPPGGPPVGNSFMNPNKPQFAPIQSANTSVNSMPYYYQQQMRSQQQQLPNPQQMQPKPQMMQKQHPMQGQQQMQTQQQQMGFSGQFGAGPPSQQGPPGPYNMWQPNSGPPQPPPGGSYPSYGNNYY